MTDYFGAQNAPGTQQFGGAGVTMEDLMKAINDVGIPAHTPGSGTLDAIMPEDLSADLVNLQFRNEHLKFGRALPGATAKNRLHQFARVVDHGPAMSPFVAEGDGPNYSADATTDRLSVLLQQVTDGYEVTEMSRHITLVGGAGASAIDFKRTEAMLRIEMGLEYLRFKGLSTCFPNAPNGFLPLLLAANPSNVIDMQGELLTPRKINAAAVKIANAFGTPDRVWMSHGVQSQLAEQQLAYARDTLPMGAQRTAVEQGAAVGKFMSSTGARIDYENHVVLQPGFGMEAYTTTAVGAVADRPATPAFSAQPSAGAPGGGEESKFGALGTVQYALIARNLKGFSAPVLSDTVSVAKGQKVSMTVNDAAVANVDCYSVFRKDSTTGGEFMFVRFAPYTGSPTVIEDLNHDRPGTSTVFMMQHGGGQATPENDPSATIREVRLGAGGGRLYELRLPTGVNGKTTEQRLLLAFLAWILLAPKKMVIFKNCYDGGVVI
jgi:hypothetical protein